MNGRWGLLRAWAVLSAGWIVGLNLLLALVIARYRSVLWGWIDLTYAIDWPRLAEASLLPPLILGAALAALGAMRPHRPPGNS